MSFVLLVPWNWSLFAEILISFCWGRIHQRSLCCSYDSCMSALGRERGIFLSSFSTRQSSEGAQISAESPRTGKMQVTAFPLPWKDCRVKFPVLQWREHGQCFGTGTLGISNAVQAINLPCSSTISPPYQDGVETILIWLQDHFTLYRVGASVSTGKCFPLFRLYKGWVLLGGRVRETLTAVHWWLSKAAQVRRHRHRHWGAGGSPHCQSLTLVVWGCLLQAPSGPALTLFQVSQLSY